MDNPLLLEISGVTKTYENTTVLENVSVAFSRGNIYGLIGANGSGKSTLLKIIAGMVQPDKGTIAMGCDPQAYADCKSTGGIVYIGEQSRLIDTLSVAENILCEHYPKSRLGTIKWRTVYHTAQALFASLGIEMDVHRRAGALEMKAKRLVELVKALYSGAKIVLFDEPDYSEDEPGFAAMHRAFERFAGNGGIVILTTHRIDALLLLVDHVMVLKEGALVYSARNGSMNSLELLQIVASREYDAHNVYPKICSRPDTELLQMKSVKLRHVRHPFSLALRRGEILGVAASNAKMRTALCKALFGIEPMEQGTLRLMGQKITIQEPAAALRFGIGYLNEDRIQSGLQSLFPIAPNISLSNLHGLKTGGVLRHKTEERVAHKYVLKFNIKTRSVKDGVTTLSTGNQQKVLLSRLLFANSRILMLEEPTRNIDNFSKIEIYSFLNSFVLQGGAIILASSHMEELIGMCDRILVLGSDGAATLFERDDFNAETILQKTQ